MRRAMAALAIAVLVGGCSGVPETSALRFGDEPGDTAGQLTRVIARPPVDGMPALAVVRGFLEACSDPSNDYFVARQYLQGGAAAKWDPAAGVRVYDSSGLTIVEKSSTITLTGRLESTISTDGLRTVVDGLPVVTETLTVAKDELGQWRIGEVPNGVLLSRSEVERSHSALAAYFLNPTLDRLVADAVVVPTSSPGLATTLVKRLLAGPSLQLGDAARTAFPTATKLTYGSVPIKGGVAYVDLTADVLAAEQPARRGLAAQLVWTLTQLPTVAAVRISVSGQLLAVPGVGVVTGTKDWKDFAPTQPATRLYSVRGATVQLISDGTSQVVSRTTEAGVRSLASVAVDPRTSRLAAVTSGGREVVANLAQTAQLEAVIKGDSMSRPSWGPAGSIFAADYGRGIRAVDAAGKQLPVVLDKTTAGSEMQVKQISFAPDGVRVALVFASGSRDVLAFGALRITDATARIAAVHRVELRITAVRDVQWSGPLTVAVLGSDGSGQQVLTVGLADGTIVGVTTPVGAQTLAVSGVGELYAGVVDEGRSTILRRRFGRWSLAGSGAGPAFGP